MGCLCSFSASRNHYPLANFIIFQSNLHNATLLAQSRFKTQISDSRYKKKYSRRRFHRLKKANASKKRLTAWCEAIMHQCCIYKLHCSPSRRVQSFKTDSSISLDTCKQILYQSDSMVFSTQGD